MDGGRREARYQHRQDPSGKQQNPESLTEIQENTAEIPESFDRLTADIKGLEADGKVVEEMLRILLARALPAPGAGAQTVEDVYFLWRSPPLVRHLPPAFGRPVPRCLLSSRSNRLLPP